MSASTSCSLALRGHTAGSAGGPPGLPAGGSTSRSERAAATLASESADGAAAWATSLADAFVAVLGRSAPVPATGSAAPTCPAEPVAQLEARALAAVARLDGACALVVRVALGRLTPWSTLTSDDGEEAVAAAHAELLAQRVSGTFPGQPIEQPPALLAWYLRKALRERWRARRRRAFIALGDLDAAVRVADRPLAGLARHARPIDLERATDDLLERLDHIAERLRGQRTWKPLDEAVYQDLRARLTGAPPHGAARGHDGARRPRREAPPGEPRSAPPPHARRARRRPRRRRGRLDALERLLSPRDA